MLRNILTREVPALAADYAHRVLGTVLERAPAARAADIAAWIMHAGGRDVLLALERRFELDRDAFRYSAAMLREYGNLSSAFVYFVLEPRSPTMRRRAGGGCRRSAPASAATARCCAVRVMMPRAARAARRSTTSRRTIRRRSARAATCAASTRSWARADPRSRARARLVPPERARAPLRILELGCGDGRLMLDVARPSRRSLAGRAARPARPPADRRRRDARRPTPRWLDAQPRSPTCWTGPPTPALRAALGRRSSPTFSCTTSMAASSPAARRVRARADALRRLRAAAQPLRAGGQPPVFFLGANAVTRQRRRAERARRLRRRELGAAWPRGRRRTGRLDEYDDGLFTHCLGARRSGPAHDRHRPTVRRQPSSAPARRARRAAILLARAGWSVALVERQAFRAARSAASASPRATCAARRARRRRRRRCARRAELRRVALMRGDARSSADLPPAEGAVIAGAGRSAASLSTPARRAGPSGRRVAFQPCALQSIVGRPVHGTARFALVQRALWRLRRTRSLVAAHGSWEALPSERQARHARARRRPVRVQGELLARGVAPRTCCVLSFGRRLRRHGRRRRRHRDARRLHPRDRLQRLRAARPGVRAGDVFEAMAAARMPGVRRRSQGATRDGPWLASGPLGSGRAPSMRKRRVFGSATPQARRTRSSAKASAWRCSRPRCCARTARATAELRRCPMAASRPGCSALCDRLAQPFAPRFDWRPSSPTSRCDPHRGSADERAADLARTAHAGRALGRERSALPNWRIRLETLPRPRKPDLRPAPPCNVAPSTRSREESP